MAATDYFGVHVEVPSVVPGIGPIKGYVFYVDPNGGNDGLSGLTPYVDGSTGDGPLKTIAAALLKCVSGRGDTVALMPYTNTSATTTDYLSAQLDWNLDNTHLVGYGPRVVFSHRSRISNATAFHPAYGTSSLMKVSGNGCFLSNFQLYYGSTTNQGEIALEVTGKRNVFDNVHIAGIAGIACSATNANSVSLYLNGAEECLFSECTVGTDTASRTAANASVKFGSAATRNQFKKCYFPMMAGATSPLFLNSNSVGSLDRTTLFKECFFDAQTIGGASTPAVMAVTHASAGGSLRAINCWANNVTAGSANLAITAAPGPTLFAGTF